MTPRTKVISFQLGGCCIYIICIIHMPGVLVLVLERAPQD
jgi:hypothetical protein